MRRTAQPLDDSLLFDLPLVAEPELVDKPQAEAAVEAVERGEAVEAVAARQIALPSAEPRTGAEPGPVAEGGAQAGASPLRRRFLAGAIDTAAIAAALVLLLAGTASLGIRPAPSDWPGFALAGLVLSFFYAVFSLLFWGKTPGMHHSGLTAGSRNGSPLTIAQALLRWLGGVCTVALVGLPTLLDLRGGGSLSDRISGSRIGAGGET